MIFQQKITNLLRDLIVSNIIEEYSVFLHSYIPFFSTVVSSLFWFDLCCCDKQHNLKHFGKETVNFILQVKFIIKRSQDRGTQSRNHRKELLIGLPPASCPATCFIMLRTTQRWFFLSRVTWTLLYQLAIKKMPQRHTHRPINWHLQLRHPHVRLY